MKKRVAGFSDRKLVLVACAALLWPGLVAASEPRVSFNRDVRPILTDACFHCHGPDPVSRKADLRLDRSDSVFRKSDPLIVAGQPDASPLYSRITSHDPDEVMPPPSARKELTAAQKETLRRWIAEGAQWESHWSFIPPTRPVPPSIKQTSWIRNPIDPFIVAKLEAVGLGPAAEADASALCRRVYLDLTGLPPTPAEVDQFVAQYGDAACISAGDREAAYLAMVDKLLDSPRYGEHRARYWLDAARYADTHGIHFDNYREIWPYRDWVVLAFQKNQPFDQFTIEQIAGDLLPNPTVEQRIATGFHRCNATTNEGGTIAEENFANYARDRVETTAWVWLGLTANCCVCHDHKFDPLTMREFYSLSAFFRNTTQAALDGNVKDSKPVLILPQESDAARYAAVQKEIVEAHATIERQRAAARPALTAWLQTVKPADLEIDANQLAFAAPLCEGTGGETTIQWKNGQALTQVKTRLAQSGELQWRADAQPGAAAVLPADNVFELKDAGDFEWSQPFSVALWLRPADKLSEGVLVARGREAAVQPGWTVSLQEGARLTLSITAAKPGQSIRAISQQAAVRLGNWTHLAVVYDGSGKADGVQLYVNGAAVEVNRGGQAIDGSIRTPSALTIGRRLDNANVFAGAALRDLRAYTRPLSAEEIRALAQLPTLKAATALPPQERKPETFESYYLDMNDSAYGQATRKLQELQREQRAVEIRATITHIQEEKTNSSAMANILMRGQYDRPGEQVTPAVFTALHPYPADAPRNRLGLARWLVDKQNPLTARVTVNRYWQELFGVGIVKTVEDFGIMGEAPSHPELLDWLAVEFRDSGWDIKHMFRLMVTSAAYRQASVVTPDKLAKDRDNRLLSRGPRFRMDAEMIRDYFLAASGTLSSRMGGPGTRPYQPTGIWDIVGLPGGNTRDYRQDSGENLYRRSLYTFWKRMAPPPSMETFNAPSREFSCLRRERTNTPLQALVTLNDDQFVEASRSVAQRILKEVGPQNVPKALDEAARRVLCRSLRAEERRVLEPAVAELLKFYGEHAAEAKQLITVGESRPDEKIDPATLAAWTNVCNTLFNMDEVLNK